MKVLDFNSYYNLHKYEPHYADFFYESVDGFKVDSINFTGIDKTYGKYDDSSATHLLLYITIPTKEFNLKMILNSDDEDNYAYANFSGHSTSRVGSASSIDTLTGTYGDDENTCIFAVRIVNVNSEQVYKETTYHSPNTFGILGKGLWRSIKPVNTVTFLGDKPFPIGTKATLCVVSVKRKPK